MSSSCYRASFRCTPQRLSTCRRLSRAVLWTPGKDGRPARERARLLFVISSRKTAHWTPLTVVVIFFFSYPQGLPGRRLRAIIVRAQTAEFRLLLALMKRERHLPARPSPGSESLRLRTVTTMLRNCLPRIRSVFFCSLQLSWNTN